MQRAWTAAAAAPRTERALVHRFAVRHRHAGAAAVRIHNVDDVTFFIAETAHIDLGAEDETHQRRVLVQFAGDLRNRARRRRMGVGQIEGDRRVKIQNKPVLAPIGGHRGLVGHVEDITREGRLGRDMHTDRHQAFCCANWCWLGSMSSSAWRARRARSSTTSCGRPGGTPLQDSGSKSTKNFSPAAMALTVTLCASAMRMALHRRDRAAPRRYRPARRLLGNAVD